MLALMCSSIPGGAVAQLGARLDGIEEVVGSNPIGSTNLDFCAYSRKANLDQCPASSGASLCRRLSLLPCAHASPGSCLPTRIPENFACPCHPREERQD